MSTFARNTPPNTGVRGSAATHRRPRPSPTLALPRPLPWESPLTRMWVGTKIICLAILTTLLVLLPTWPTVAAVGVCLLVAAVVGRVPISARPRLPSWIWAGFIGGMIGAAIGGGALIFVRAFLVMVEVILGSLLLVWTTPIERIAPALRTLLHPLTWFRAPVDEWVMAASFALRGLSTVRDQMQAVFDAVRLRWTDDGPMMTFRGQLKLIVDMTTATLSASSRRADDTGRAMTMRGGIPPVERDRVRFRWPDIIGLVLVLAATVISVIFRSGVPWQ